MKCGQCRFFCQDGADNGLCRRYPPTPVMYAYGVFPRVEKDSASCGEFATKEEKRKTERMKKHELA